MRSLAADGAKLAELRARKGWSQEELAATAELSRRAIQRIERGGAAYLGTLAMIAKALDVKVQDLLPANVWLKDEAPEIPGAARIEIPEPQKAVAAITIPEDFPTWTDEKQAEFVRQIAELAGTQGEIKVISKKQGSVTLVLEMSADDAERVVTAWDQGKLDGLNISSIDLEYQGSPRTPVLFILPHSSGVNTSEQMWLVVNGLSLSVGGDLVVKSVSEDGTEFIADLTDQQLAQLTQVGGAIPQQQQVEIPFKDIQMQAATPNQPRPFRFPAAPSSDLHAQYRDLVAMRFVLA